MVRPFAVTLRPFPRRLIGRLGSAEYLRRATAIGFALAVIALGTPATAATYWWNTADGLWTTGANWSNAASGGTTGTVPVSGTADAAIFNQTGLNNNQIITLGTSTTIGSIQIDNTGSTTILSDSSTSRNLTIGTGGSFVVNAGAGPVTIGDAANPVTLVMANTQTWTNNSANTLTVVNGINANGVTTIGLSGSGNTTISGSITAAATSLSKNGLGTLTLSGTNTFSGAVTVTTGTVAVTTIANSGVNSSLGSGSTISISSGGGFVGSLRYIGTGDSTNRAVSLAGSSVILDQSGSGQLTFTGNMNYTYATAPGFLTLQGSTSGTGVISGIIATATTNTIGVTKAGTGIWRLSGANTYSGATTISGGTLVLSNSNAIQSSSLVLTGTGNVAFDPAVSGSTFNMGGLVFGAAAGATATANLDLTNASASVGSLTVRTNSSGTNLITVGSGQTLTTLGNVSMGGNSYTTRATVAGATAGVGSMVITNTAASGSVVLGPQSGNGGSLTLDMSSLGTFTANLSGSSSVFRVGNSTNNQNIGYLSNVYLAASSTITAKTIGLSDNGGDAMTTNFYLGSGAQQLNADTINVAGGSRGVANVLFAEANGSVTVRGQSSGTSRADMSVISGAMGGGGLSASVNLTGHDADLRLGSLSLGNAGGGSGPNATFSFDQGTLDATTVLVGGRYGSTTGGSATLNLGSSGNAAVNTSLIGTLSMAGNVVTAGTATGTLNIAGVNTTVTATGAWTVATVSATSASGATARGAVNISGGTVNANTGIILRSGSGFGTASGTLSITGGSLVSGGNITSTGSFGGGAATLTLNGGSLDLGGFAIGGSGQTVTTNFQSGTLSNVGEVNAGAGWSKTTAGTLTLTGSNGYSGGTTLSAGRLNINTASAIGSGSLAVAASGTLGNTSGTAVTLSNRALSFAGDFRYAGSSDLDLGAGSISISGTRTITVDAGRLTIGSTITTSTFGLTKAGAGTLALTGLSTYGGVTTVSAGTLEFNSIADAGTASALGQPAAASGTIGLSNGATLRYTGTGSHATNRTINLATASSGTATLDASGSGAMTLENLAAATGSKTLILAGLNANDNRIGLIPNPTTSGSTSVVKQGPGRWMLMGSSTYSGSTTVEEGTLVLGVSAVGSGSGSLGSNTSGAALTLGSATGSGTAALLLAQNVTIDSRNTQIPAIVSGSQVVILGGANTSGTSTFSNVGSMGFVLGRDVTLQAATGGTVVFDNAWSSGTGRNVTVGSAGNAGTVQLGSALAVTGAVQVANGALRLASGGSLADAAEVIVGTAGSSGVVLDVTSQIGTYTSGSTQTLSGIGTLRLDADTPVSIAGIFSPGNSPGLFTFDGSGTTTLAGTTLMEIEGVARGVAGGYDAVNLTNGSALVLGGALQLWFSGTFAQDTPFQLFTVSGAGLSGNFTGVSVSGSSLAYTGLTWSQDGSVWNSTTTPGGQALRFNSSDGTLVVVPEPATLAVVAMGLALGGWASIRRRR